MLPLALLSRRGQRLALLDHEGSYQFDGSVARIFSPMNLSSGNEEDLAWFHCHNWLTFHANRKSSFQDIDENVARVSVPTFLRTRRKFYLGHHAFVTWKITEVLFRQNVAFGACLLSAHAASAKQCKERDAHDRSHNHSQFRAIHNHLPAH